MDGAVSTYLGAHKLGSNLSPFCDSQTSESGILISSKHTYTRHFSSSETSTHLVETDKTNDAASKCEINSGFEVIMDELDEKQARGAVFDESSLPSSPPTSILSSISHESVPLEPATSPSMPSLKTTTLVLKLQQPRPSNASDIQTPSATRFPLAHAENKSQQPDVLSTLENTSPVMLSLSSLTHSTASIEHPLPAPHNPSSSPPQLSTPASSALSTPLPLLPLSALSPRHLSQLTLTPPTIPVNRPLSTPTSSSPLTPTVSSPSAALYSPTSTISQAPTPSLSQLPTPAPLQLPIPTLSQLPASTPLQLPALTPSQLPTLTPSPPLTPTALPRLVSLNEETLTQTSQPSSYTPPEAPPPSWPKPPSPTNFPSPPPSPPPLFSSPFANNGKFVLKEVEVELIQKQEVKKEQHYQLQHEDSTLKLVQCDPIEITAHVEPIKESTPEAELKQKVLQHTVQPEEQKPLHSKIISLPANNQPDFRNNRNHLRQPTKVSPPRNAQYPDRRISDSDKASESVTWYLSPPANKVGWKTNDRPHVVDRQPNVWVPYSLDPISKIQLDDLPAFHKSHDKLKMLLKTEIGEMSKESNEYILPDSISYTEFFRGLLYDDEEILMNNQYIPFRHAVFNLFDDWLPKLNTTTNKNTDNVQIMLMGRAILTNHRLILISAEQQQGAELRIIDLNNTTGKVGSYQIRTSHHDTLHYRSIPLNKFQSVEMQASVGVIKSTNVTGSRVVCCSCTCLPGCDVFSKRWEAQEATSIRTNTRLVTCGVVLPPWDTRAVLQIYMEPSVPLYHIKKFMLELQNNAPGLHPSAAPSFAGY